MRVLMISGDPNLAVEGTSAHERLMLQKVAVERLEVILWPKEFLKPFFIRGVFDVVTSQDPFWRGLLSLFVAKRLGARLNVQLHADLTSQSALKQMLAHLVFRHAQSVRVVSTRLKLMVEKYTKARISVLPIFIDKEKFKNISRSVHSRWNNTLLWIGRFEDEKNPLAALSVLHDVRKSGMNAGLIMLGEGSLSGALQDAAKVMGLLEFVEFPGWQDPLRYLGVASVVFSTSRQESWGASITEAVAAGVPLVSPDVGSAREAGARIARQEDIADEIGKVIQSHMRGHLKIALPSAEEWSALWKQTL